MTTIAIKKVENGFELAADSMLNGGMAFSVKKKIVKHSDSNWHFAIAGYALTIDLMEAYVNSGLEGGLPNGVLSQDMSYADFTLFILGFLDFCTEKDDSFDRSEQRIIGTNGNLAFAWHGMHTNIIQDYFSIGSGREFCSSFLSEGFEIVDAIMKTSIFCEYTNDQIDLFLVEKTK